MRSSGTVGYRLSIAERAGCLALAAVIVGGFVTAATVVPDPRGFGTHEQLGLPPCGFRLMFNVPCPSCGGTTSFSHFVRGQWGRALSSNVAAFLMAVVSLAALPWLAGSAIAGRLWRVEEPFRALFIVLAVIVAAGLLTWASRILHAFAWTP